MDKELGKKIREMRQARGLTLKELAEKCGISYAQLSRVELGQRGLGRAALKLIMREMISATKPTDDLETLKGHLNDEEIRLIRAWRRLPKSIRAYQLHYMTVRAADSPEEPPKA